MQNTASIEFRNFIASLSSTMTRQQRQGLLTGLEMMAANGERQQGAFSAAAPERSGEAKRAASQERRNLPQSHRP